MIMLWRLDAHATNAQAARAMVVAGIGIGSMMQVFVLSVQNAVPPARIGSATALTQFSRQIGATVGVAIMGAIVNSGLPPAADSGAASTIHRLPPALRQALADALHPAFFAAAVVSLLVWLIAVLGVKEVPLRRTLDDAVAADAVTGAPATTPVDSRT